MWPRVGALRALEFGTPGGFQDHLTGLVLTGAKVATAGLWKQDYVDEGEDLDVVGEQQVLLHNDEPTAVVEITRVETHRFADVPWEFAEAEGEGFASIEDWRNGHRAFYAQRGLAVSDDDRVVCVWFRVLNRLNP